MDIWQLLRGLLFDYTLRTVALGSATLGIVSGALGSYAVLRKQSLLGDAISHAALPGVVLAFVLTRSKDPVVLMLGALAAGWLGTLAMLGITRSTRLKDDSALGLVLSVFFGFGLMLLTFVQKLPDATQAGLDKFLFGQAATLLASDVVVMAAGGTAVLTCVGLFWKEFKLLTFDPTFAASLGFQVRVLDVLLTTLLVVAIVIGLQTVGVVLMSAMVVAPAVAARQWTQRLSTMVVLAALFGATAGVVGALISSSGAGLSTGPTIVLCISAIVAFSMLLAPERGLLPGWVRHQRNRRRLRVNAVLSDLYVLAEQHADQQHGHSAEVLRAMSNYAGGVAASLKALEARGWAQKSEEDEWSLTPAGLAEAQSQRGQVQPGGWGQPGEDGEQAASGEGH
jgi:manganese/zinc/iron transport system permease protein